VNQSNASVSSAKSSPGKPAKPHPDFPLFPHASGRWAKKVRGKLCYFGKWGDPDAALNKWLDQKDDLLAGRKPRPNGEAAGPTVQLVVNSFLTHKERQRDNGEIQPRTFDELFDTGVRIAAAFGRDRLVSDLTPEDFAELRKQLAKHCGPVRLSNMIQRVRSVFLFGYNDGIIPNPVRFGMGFNKPSAKTLRKERAKKGARDLQADQIRKLIDVAGVPLKAMILLGVNCGFGNADVGRLPLSAIDFPGGWVNFPRPKTGVDRRAKLWPETAAAIKAAIDARPDHKDRAHAGLVFVTKYGGSWAKGEAGNDPVGLAFRRLLADEKMDRPGTGFYSLRRSFETVAGESLDQPAVDLVMGHVAGANDMAAVYRQRIGDDRLVKVAEHVRAWLFAKPNDAAKM
jgi:integrase